MLAYDQGLEHGPRDFNEKNYDPNYILNIAKEGGYSCVTLQYGIAEKFWKDNFESIPLVLKLNGKTSLGKKAYSVAESTVKDAITLGAVAVGFTIYLGSEYEAEMIKEFSRIRDEAHENNLAILAWVYPFITPPSSNDDEREADIVAYAARAGAELGADAIKLKYPHQPEKLEWITKNAVGTRILMSGGDKVEDTKFLEMVKLFMDAGGDGLAVGRNIWQHENPLEMTQKVKEVMGL